MLRRKELNYSFVKSFLTDFFLLDLPSAGKNKASQSILSLAFLKLQKSSYHVLFSLYLNTLLVISTSMSIKPLNLKRWKMTILFRILAVTTMTYLITFNSTKIYRQTLSRMTISSMVQNINRRLDETI